MGIFDFLRRPPTHQHSQLGPLEFASGRWRGTIELERGTPTTLFLPGTRSGPLPAGLELAATASGWWARVRPAVEEQLFEHYRIACDAGVSDLPDLADSPDVWRHVSLSSVQIGPHQRLDELQVALRPAWDDDHTLGALIRDASLVELNGSILEPR